MRLYDTNSYLLDSPNGATIQREITMPKGTAVNSRSARVTKSRVRKLLLTLSLISCVAESPAQTTSSNQVTPPNATTRPSALQSRASAAPQSTPPRSRRSTSRPSRRQFGRLARIPEMFGDFFGTGQSQFSLGTDCAICLHKMESTPRKQRYEMHCI